MFLVAFIIINTQNVLFILKLRVYPNSNFQGLSVDKISFFPNIIVTETVVH